MLPQKLGFAIFVAVQHGGPQKDCQNQGPDRHYKGETGNEARIRAQQHLPDLKAKKPSSGLYRHTMEYGHGGVQPTFRFQVRQSFGDPLTHLPGKWRKVQEQKLSLKKSCSTTNRSGNHPYCQDWWLTDTRLCIVKYAKLQCYYKQLWFVKSTNQNNNVHIILITC